MSLQKQGSNLEIQEQVGDPFRHIRRAIEIFKKSSAKNADLQRC